MLFSLRSHVAGMVQMMHGEGKWSRFDKPVLSQSKGSCFDQLSTNGEAQGV